MIDSNLVTLETATTEDGSTLENLLELYAHDLSAVFGLDLGHDGRFGYPKLPLYWSEPERRFPFLVRCGGRLAGFALVTRGSPASDDPEVHDLAEFFVVRRYRRSGVGQRAAFLVWDRFPVAWTVRVSEGNDGGCKFWSNVIASYSKEGATRTALAGNPHGWRVFSFDSRNRRVVQG